MERYQNSQIPSKSFFVATSANSHTLERLGRWSLLQELEEVERRAGPMTGPIKPEQFPLSLEIDRILVEVDRSRPAIFERIEEILSASYWAGMTSRKPGYPTPRDKAVVDFAERRLSDNSLSPRLRQYYSARRDASTASIENDPSKSPSAGPPQADGVWAWPAHCGQLTSSDPS